LVKSCKTKFVDKLVDSDGLAAVVKGFVNNPAFLVLSS